jgi:organic hydroperoxide reductase OsmC/OhrA
LTSTWRARERWRDAIEAAHGCRRRARSASAARAAALQIAKLHELAHENCFIANSVRTAIAVTQDGDGT